MSTKIECTTCADVTIGFDRADPNRTTGEFYIFMGEEGHYVLRADFLAAVETECDGRFVPTPEPLADWERELLDSAEPVNFVRADAIVIDRAELPEVEVSDIPGGHEVLGHTYSITEAAVARGYALNLLALAEYLDAHPPTPPVDEAQVEAVNDVLASYVARWRRNDLDLARQLVAWGVRVDLP